MFQKLDEEADDNSLDMYNLQNSEHQHNLNQDEMLDQEDEYDDDGDQD